MLKKQTDSSAEASAPVSKYNGSSKSYAERAFHPDEVLRSEGSLKVDIDWYLTQQIMPPVQRLCDPIAGTSPQLIAENLGLDSSKYKLNANGMYGNEDEDDGELVNITEIDDAERYKNCDRVELCCEKCGEQFQYNGPFTLPSTLTGDATSKEQPNLYLNGLACSKCEHVNDCSVLHNVLVLAARKAVEKYYSGWLVADDPSAELRTRQQSVNGRSWVMNGRRVQLMQEVSIKVINDEFFSNPMYFSTPLRRFTRS